MICIVVLPSAEQSHDPLAEACDQQVVAVSEVACCTVEAQHAADCEVVVLSKGRLKEDQMSSIMGCLVEKPEVRFLAA